MFDMLRKPWRSVEAWFSDPQPSAQPRHEAPAEETPVATPAPRAINAEATAARLHDAVDGMGTDEEAVFGAFAGRSEAERRAIVASYDREAALRGDPPLHETLADEMSGLDLEKARALVAHGAVDDALAVDHALHGQVLGLGTDEEALRQVLAGKSREEIDQLAQAYARRQGSRDAGRLAGDIDDETSGRDAFDLGRLLEGTGPELGSEALEALLDATTGSTASEGNLVTPLYDGVSSYAERAAMIGMATESIDLQTFIFDDDATGWQTALGLAQKAEEGVSVRVIYDSLGSTRASDAMFEFMREHGVDVREHADPLEDPLSLNQRWHEKQLIVDGARSIGGGMNIADEYALGGTGEAVPGFPADQPFRDTDVLLEGPAVRDAADAFDRNWASVGGEPRVRDEGEGEEPVPSGDASVRVVQNHPEKGENHIESLYLGYIRGAQKSITIENAYFIPSDEIRFELMAAAQRGVQVRIMTNSRESNDNGFVADASRYFFDELVGAGVQIFEKDGGTLHSKTAAFDDTHAIIGSANLNGRSRAQDSEIVLGVSGGGVAQSLEERFTGGLEEAHPVRAEDLDDESAWTDLRQFVFSRFRDSF